MPEKETLRRARKDAAEGKSASTQAAEFVREEIHHIREGKHGARSAKQAIAIGLSKARRAGVKMPPPKPGSVSEETRRSIARDSKRVKPATTETSTKRGRASLRALKEEGQSAGTHLALARHARAVARRRSASERSETALKAAKTRVW